MNRYLTAATEEFMCSCIHPNMGSRATGHIPALREDAKIGRIPALPGCTGDVYTRIRFHLMYMIGIISSIPSWRTSCSPDPAPSGRLILRMALGARLDLTGDTVNAASVLSFL